mmetsp:Transcript_30755/g.45556  ORF Transcript_30755/g.45556 Transcript_30755/m.45556 type:complete len:92 (+) Transcript_30755:130-405(+)
MELQYNNTGTIGRKSNVMLNGTVALIHEGTEACFLQSYQKRNKGVQLDPCVFGRCDYVLHQMYLFLRIACLSRNKITASMHPIYKKNSRPS